MKNYYKMMLGSKSKFAQDCFNGGFIGADYNIHIDLTNQPSGRKEFIQKYIPVYLASNPEKSKMYAGVICNALWVLFKGINTGDIVVCPNGKGVFYFGEVTDDYSYHPGEILPHRRHVKWYPATKKRSEASLELRNTSTAQGTALLITQHAAEIENYIAGANQTGIISTDPLIEDPSVFALEKHLEDFLIQNWKQTELGKNYEIYEEDGEIAGQQYPSDTGPIDILAISKDKKTLLVVELKKGRASDYVVGQIQRYMGYVQEELLEENQEVKGVIIALEDDIRIRRALSVAPNIEFYRYQVSFKLFKA